MTTSLKSLRIRLENTQTAAVAPSKQSKNNSHGLVAILAVAFVFFFVIVIDSIPCTPITSDVDWSDYLRSGDWNQFGEDYGVISEYNNPILKVIDVYAITIGDTIYYSGDSDNVPQRLRQHEFRHVEQMRRDGAVVFFIKYFTDYTKGIFTGIGDSNAYINIAYELDATSAELD